MAIMGGYDIIIMDLNMPIMDGFKSTTKIKDYYDSSNLFLPGRGLASKRGDDKLDDMCKVPFIVALTGEIISDELVQKL